MTHDYSICIERTLIDDPSFPWSHGSARPGPAFRIVQRKAGGSTVHRGFAATYAEAKDVAARQAASDRRAGWRVRIVGADYLCRGLFGGEGYTPLTPEDEAAAR